MGEVRSFYSDPIIMSPSQIITTIKISKSPNSFLDKLKNNKPLYVMKDDDIKAVVITVDDYRRLLVREFNTPN